jgi:hypothetical protein
MTVVSGRLRHDPKSRSREILRKNTRSRSINVAETMTSLVHEVVDHERANGSTPGQLDGLVRRARGVWGTVRENPFPYTRNHFADALNDLRRLGDLWTRTPAGDVLSQEWPAGLLTRPAHARSRNGARRG